MRSQRPGTTLAGRVSLFALFFFGTLSFAAPEEFKFSRARYCGLDVLILLSKHYNIELNRRDAVGLLMPRPNGEVSFLALQNAFEAIGLYPLSLKCTPKELSKSNTPSVLFVDENHYVVFLGMKEDKFVIVNFPQDPYVLGADGLDGNWKGECIMVFRTVEERKTCIDRMGLPQTKGEDPSSEVADGSDNAEELPTEPNAEGLSFNRQIFKAQGVKPYETIGCSFSYVNNHDVPIEIKNVKPSCGCSTVDYKKGIVAPGETGEITVDINTSSSPLRSLFYAYVMTDWAENRLQELQIEVNVDRDVSTNKSEIDFLDVPFGESAEKEFRMRVLGGRRYRLSGVESSSKCVTPTIVVRENDPVWREIVVLVKITPDCPWGRIDEEITLSFVDSIRRPVRIPVTGEVLCPYVVTPSQLVLDTSNCGEFPSQAYVAAVTVRDASISIADLPIRCSEDSGLVEITTEKNPESNLCRIRARVKAKPETSLQSGKISLYFGDEKQAVEIPYSIVYLQKIAEGDN